MDESRLDQDPGKNQPSSTAQACDELFEIIEGAWPKWLRAGFPDGCRPVQEVEMFNAYASGAITIAMQHYRILGFGKKEVDSLAALATKRLLSERVKRMEEADAACPHGYQTDFGVEPCILVKGHVDPNHESRKIPSLDRTAYWKDGDENDRIRPNVASQWEKPNKGE